MKCLLNAFVSLFFSFHLLSLLLSLPSASSSFSDVDVYTESDLFSTTPTFIFIYYDGKEKGKCMACEGYKEWITSLGREVEGFAVKKLNFCDHPRLVLRFKTVEFPTFFLQHGRKFKNLSSFDFFDMDLLYKENKKYQNEIDAIFKNISLLERIPTIQGVSSPSSFFSLLYSYFFFFLLSVSYLLDRLSSLLPLWALLLSSLVLILSVRLFSRKHKSK